MATPADSRDVKSLNNSEGTNKFLVRLLVRFLVNTVSENSLSLFVCVTVVDACSSRMSVRKWKTLKWRR